MGEKLDDLQQSWVVEESESPWSSQVYVVRKKNGNLRFRVDYRKLNNATGKDCLPPSRIMTH